jgi:hypothetical protein
MAVETARVKGYCGGVSWQMAGTYWPTLVQSKAVRVDLTLAVFSSIVLIDDKIFTKILPIASQARAKQ